MAGFRHYKSGQEGLQMGQLKAFQIGSREITNRGKNFKSRQGLQIGAELARLLNCF